MVGYHFHQHFQNHSFTESHLARNFFSPKYCNRKMLWLQIKEGSVEDTIKHWC